MADWRIGHEAFWHSEQVRAELGDPGFTVDDDTLVVAQGFRVVAPEPPDLPGLLRAARTTSG